jgi:hypothetical protein
MIRAVGAGVVLIGCCAAIARIPNLVEAPGRFLLLFALAFASYAAGIWWLPRGDGWRSVSAVLAVGIAARLALAPAAPTLSTDAYRYVWDARVAQAGISPYAYAPAASELASLRDAEIFPRLNHPTWRTIYPPGAEAFFRAVYRIRPDSVWAMKLAIGLAELLGLFAVYGLLRAGGRPLSQAVIYAWNPLVLVEVWGTGHVDGLLVPLVAAAAWLTMRGRHAGAGALLGAGALIKLYPAVLLPLFAIAAWPVAAASFAAVLLAGYVPGWLAGSPVLGSLPQYLVEEYFNPGLVRSIVETPDLTLLAGGAWILGVSAVRRDAPLPSRAIPLIGGLLLLSPNLFPWYAIWLVPFLAWSPSVPWIAFTGTVVLAYSFFLQQPWSIPGWARALEFAPLGLGAVWWLTTRHPVRRWQERST